MEAMLIWPARSQCFHSPIVFLLYAFAKAFPVVVKAKGFAYFLIFVALATAGWLRRRAAVCFEPFFLLTAVFVGERKPGILTGSCDVVAGFEFAVDDGVAGLLPPSVLHGKLFLRKSRRI